MRRLFGFFSTLERIEHTLHHVSRKVDGSMAIAQEILDGIAALNSSVAALQASVEQIITAVDGLVAAGTLTPEQAAQILGNIAADKTAVDTSKGLLDAEVVKLSPPPPAPAV